MRSQPHSGDDATSPHPTRGEVTSLPAGPAPRLNATLTAVPEANAVLLVGGEDPATGTLAGDAWTLDTASLTWSRLPFDLPRAGHTAVCIGGEVLVFGGRGAAGVMGSPVRINVRARTLAPLTATGAPSPRVGHAAVALGDAMLVWGGRDADGATLADGALYEPARGGWRTIASRGAPAARSEATLVWTGDEAVVWGGADEARMPGEMDAAAYDPLANRWRALAREEAPPPVAGAVGAWTGRELIVAAREGWFAYDIATDRWRALGRPAPRGAAVVAWSGGVVAVGGTLAGDPGDDVRFLAVDGTETVLAHGALPSPREDMLVAIDGAVLYALFGRVGRHAAPGGVRLALH